LEVSGKLYDQDALTTGEKATGTNWMGGWVGPRNVLDDVESRKILPRPGLELRPLGRSQSLYRLRYSGSTSNAIDVK
jgi:hypothetical protein